MNLAVAKPNAKFAMPLEKTGRGRSLSHHRLVEA